MSKHILLVDDDADDRDLFSEAVSLVDPSVKLEVKCDGEELLSYLASASEYPDVIFLDLNMPRKNGKECLFEMRCLDQLKKIPVIIYTTSLSPLDIEETFKAGANRFLRKPNTFEDLKKSLALILADGMGSLEERTKANYVLPGRLQFTYR